METIICTQCGAEIPYISGCVICPVCGAKHCGECDYYQPIKK